MKYDLRAPCLDCPFLEQHAESYGINRLLEFAQGPFPCHKTADLIDNDEDPSHFVANRNSQHCAGALIFLKKRHAPHQMMRIAERLGMYDAEALDMEAPVV